MTGAGQLTERRASEGRLVVISAPSGAGKTSLVRALLAVDNANQRIRLAAAFNPRISGRK